ncbi:MAG: GntR family transcriptional regulator [Roseibium sp.]|uniref:GntR family transcriptional regulator n=1 Tax=Roseibium sp. TaxID=1936156 RepID=UPI00262555A1|nr:GntR family transcriptional regulator [Roseibium sp.]MCV0426924.1 GntR family transcriptional regulator [Roseibium sp.]
MSKEKPQSSALEQINQRRSKTLSTIVCEAIEQMIISGELEAGDRINESALANRLGVSRGPIREACRSLEQAGLLVSATNHGMYVREMTLDEARDLYEMRGALAGLTGRLIVERASDETLQNLLKLVEKMDVAADEGNLSRYYTLNLDFHALLVKAAENPALQHSYRWIVNQLHLFRRRGLVQEGNLVVSNQEHRVIIDALLARDPEAAEIAMRQHVAGGWARMSSPS